MSPEKQRVAIMKACGWGDPHWVCPKCGRVESSHVTFEERHDKDGCLSFVYWFDRPDYLNDLNAMADVELWLENSRGVHFMEGYYEKHLPAAVGGPAGCWKVVSATAAQRAEAFLRALNLWQEEPAP